MSSQFQPYVARDRQFGPFRFDFHIVDAIGQSWYDASADQFMPERAWCMEHIRPGFTVLDCGAHHGMMTVLFALMTGPTGRVLAWDALPENAETVQRNAELNGCRNVQVFGHALGERREAVSYDPNFGNINVVSDSTRASPLATLQVVPLDDDIEPGLRIDFLKLDVEGSELPALRGAAGVLRQRPFIDLELHNFLFKDRQATLDAIFALLDACDYRYEVLPEVFEAVVPVGSAVDTAWLSSFYNPHVFCIPH
jgi:FkbM family methyltransferase